MTLPHVNAGEVARAADQNDVIDTVNGHTGSITSATDILGTHETRLDTLETAPSEGSDAGAYFGQWTDNNAGNAGQSIDTEAGEKVTEINAPVGTATGCSLDRGTLTVQQPGMWVVNASVQYAGGTSVRATWIARGSATSGAGLAKLGPIAGPSMDAQSSVTTLRLNAGDTVSVYAAVWQGGAPVPIWRAHGNNLTAVWLGP